MAHQAGVYPGFWSIKPPGIPPGWDTSPSQRYSQHQSKRYLSGSGTLAVSGIHAGEDHTAVKRKNPTRLPVFAASNFARI